MEQVEKTVLRMDRLWSVYREDSEVSAINMAAGTGAVTVSAETLCMLSTGKQLAARTNGAFGLTTRPLTELWLADRAPKASAVSKARALVNDDALVLNAETRTAYLTQRGMGIDLGGIAKGYAADTARRMLLAVGVKDAILNFGGTVTVIGGPRPVGIRNPFGTEGGKKIVLNIKDTSVVTSGTYERGAHIIDINTGRPSASEIVSATVIMPAEGSTCVSAGLDVLATACIASEKEKAAELLKRFNAEGIFIFSDGNVFCTPDLFEKEILK